MSGQPDKAKVEAAARLKPADVANWLRDHPDFLTRHPDLLEILTPPAKHSGNGVADLQQFMLAKLQTKLSTTLQSQESLVAATRVNMSTQSMVHEAVLALLDATTFEHLIHIATQDCAELLDVDVITLCVEASPAPAAMPLPRVTTNGVVVLRPGDVDALIGGSHDVILREDSRDSDVIFGPAAELVRSDALVRLRFGPNAPAGLLALGSREVGKFHNGQGTELLSFLARVLERNVRQWLDLPAHR